jgi:Zn-dependent protease with chaperone function
MYFDVIQGLIAIAVFMFYLSTIWYFAYPAYKLIFQADVKRSSFIISNLKLNFPILFPWLILSFLFDLISLSPWSGLEKFLIQPAGQMLFFSVFLIMLIIFIPSLVQYWWRCKPFEMSEKVRDIKNFLNGMNFRYRDLVNWPIFEGRLMTAGIMGIIPRFRYILVTKSLMDILSNTELKAVMAHEVGHARYRHQIFYAVFFLGFLAITLGLSDPEFYFRVIGYLLTKFSIKDISPNLLFSLSAVPLLITLVIYFRFIMGFFMRHFERQADLYSAEKMGDPAPTISALEKIGILSGKIRNLPSWHHFSIKERVEYLRRSKEEPDLVRRHNKLLFLSFIIYLVCISGLIYFTYFTPVKDRIIYNLIEKDLSEQLVERPDDPRLLNELAMLYLEMDNHVKAYEKYQRLLSIDKIDANGLNNLAWLLVTSPNESIRDNKRGLLLAKEAVKLEKNPQFLDTLAEAYWVNGDIEHAVKAINEAIILSGKDDPLFKYYNEQLKKFLASSDL